jgi:hypothetical protein
VGEYNVVITKFLDYQCAADVVPVLVKNGGGFLMAAIALNYGAATRFLKFWDSVGAPIVGTDRPFFAQGVNTLAPATIASSNSFAGIPFVNGLWTVVTVNFIFTDATAPGAGEVNTRILYR